MRLKYIYTMWWIFLVFFESIKNEIKKKEIECEGEISGGFIGKILFGKMINRCQYLINSY